MTSKKPLLQPPTETTSKVTTVQYYFDEIVIWLTFSISSTVLLDELQGYTFAGIEYFDNNRRPPGYNDGDIFHLPFHNRFNAQVRLFCPSVAAFEMLQELGRLAMRAPGYRHSMVQSQFKVTSGTFVHEIICPSDADATLVAEYLNSVIYERDGHTTHLIPYQTTVSENSNEPAARAQLVCNSASSLRSVGVHGLADLVNLNHDKVWKSQVLLQERIGKKIVAIIDPTQFHREYRMDAISLIDYRSLGYAIPA